VVPIVAGALNDPAALLDADPSPPATLEFHRVHVPLRRPHRSAHGEERTRESILVRWTHADGTVGWGECPALTGTGYVTESTDRAWDALCGTIGPATARGDLVPAEVVRSHPASTAAMADARLDAVLRSQGRSLADLWSAARRVAGTTVLAMVGEPPEVVAERAAEAVSLGAAMVKVKAVVGSAAPLVRAVLDAVGSTPVAVDLNGSSGDPGGGWPPDLDELVQLPLAYLEQPFDPSVPDGSWVRLAGRGTVRLAVDESADSPDSIERMVRSGAAAVVSVKPARLGGVVAAGAAAGRARALGAQVFVGGMFELGVGRSSALALAAADPTDLPTDLGPSDRYVAEDVTEAIVADRTGRIVVPRTLGAAQPPTAAALERFGIQVHRVVR
jgi:O-succinylbenzoate synthase